MLEAREDRAEVMTLENGEKKYAPAIEVLNRRGEVSSTIGCWPWMKPWAKYIPDPFFNSKSICNVIMTKHWRKDADVEGM